MTVENGALVIKVAKPRKRRRYLLEDLIVGITKESSAARSTGARRPKSNLVAQAPIVRLSEI